MKKLMIIGIAIAALLAALITGTVLFYRSNTPTEPTITAPEQTTTQPVPTEIGRASCRERV